MKQLIKGYLPVVNGKVVPSVPLKSSIGAGLKAKALSLGRVRIAARRNERLLTACAKVLQQNMSL